MSSPIDIISKMNDQEYPTTRNFNVEPFPRDSFGVNFTLLEDSNLVIRFVATYLIQIQNKSRREIEELEQIYETMLNGAIKRNYLEIIEIFWNGLSNVRQKSSLAQLKTAVQYSDLSTLVMVIINFTDEYHHQYDEDFPYISCSDIMELARSNPNSEIEGFISYIIKISSKNIEINDDYNVVRLLDGWDPDYFSEDLLKYFSGRSTKGVR